MDNVWVGLEERDERGPKGWVLCVSWNASVGNELEILRSSWPLEQKKDAPKHVCEHPFCSGLRDCGFPCPRESIEPEDRRLVEIFGPPLDFVQHALPSSFKAAAPVPMSIFGPLRTTTAVQH